MPQLCILIGFGMGPINLISFHRVCFMFHTWFDLISFSLCKILYVQLYSFSKEHRKFHSISIRWIASILFYICFICTLHFYLWIIHLDPLIIFIWTINDVKMHILKYLESKCTISRIMGAKCIWSNIEAICAF